MRLPVPPSRRGADLPPDLALCLPGAANQGHQFADHLFELLGLGRQLLRGRRRLLGIGRCLLRHLVHLAYGLVYLLYPLRLLLRGRGNLRNKVVSLLGARRYLPKRL